MDEAKASVEAELEQTKALLQTVFDENPDPILIIDATGKLSFNKASEWFMKVSTAQNVSDWETSGDKVYAADRKTLMSLNDYPLMRALKGEIVPETIIYIEGPSFPGGTWLSANGRPLSSGGAISVVRDVTEKMRLEESLASRNDELRAALETNNGLVERLRIAVDELSTPVLEIWTDVLVMPVVGVVDTQRSAQMTDRLLGEIVAKQARFVILDLTGVDLVDTSTADRFVKLAKAAEFLGCECVLTGIQPAVAQTLTGLGVEFSGLGTQRNLKQALEYCMKRSRSV